MDPIQKNLKPYSFAHNYTNSPYLEPFFDIRKPPPVPPKTPIQTQTVWRKNRISHSPKNFAYIPPRSHEIPIIKFPNYPHPCEQSISLTYSQVPFDRSRFDLKKKKAFLNRPLN